MEGRNVRGFEEIREGERNRRSSKQITIVRSAVFTAATMKNAVFWDKETLSYLTGGTILLRYRVQSVDTMLDLRFSQR
jgi:hypothetical protein